MAQLPLPTTVFPSLSLQCSIFQFQDFYAFCEAVDTWECSTVSSKWFPPKEWRDSLPDLRPVLNSAPSTTASTSDATSAEQDDRADISKVAFVTPSCSTSLPAGSGVWRQINTTTRSAKIWNAKHMGRLCVFRGSKGPRDGPH